MVKKIDDHSFGNFVKDSFYSAVGFYYPEAANRDDLFKVMEEFSEGYGNVACATMDITGQEVPEEFGITEDVSPIIVIFKQGNPVKAVNVFTVESVASAIAPPGKNITLQ